MTKNLDNVIYDIRILFAKFLLGHSVFLRYILLTHLLLLQLNCQCTPKYFLLANTNVILQSHVQYSKILKQYFSFLLISAWGPFFPIDLFKQMYFSFAAEQRICFVVVQSSFFPLIINAIVAAAYSAAGRRHLIYRSKLLQAETQQSFHSSLFEALVLCRSCGSWSTFTLFYHFYGHCDEETPFFTVVNNCISDLLF